MAASLAPDSSLQPSCRPCRGGPLAPALYHLRRRQRLSKSSCRAANCPSIGRRCLWSGRRQPFYLPRMVMPLSSTVGAGARSPPIVLLQVPPPSTLRSRRSLGLLRAVALWPGSSTHRRPLSLQSQRRHQQCCTKLLPQHLWRQGARQWRGPRSGNPLRHEGEEDPTIA